VPRPDHGLWTVDRAVRALAAACERANRGVPAAHAIVVGSDTVVFHLGTPDERPPAGWTAAHDGRIWRAQLRWLQSANVADIPREPYPRLVSLGTGADGFVLLNLGLAGGVIGLEGDARQARALAQDWIRELTTSPWSREVRVVGIGFPPAPDSAASDRVTGARTLADAEEVLADEGGGVLLLAGAPGGRDRERVQQLADDAEGRWSVVVVGRTEQPRWRFTLDSAGVVDTGLLDGPVAHLLIPSSGVSTPEATGADITADAPAGLLTGTAPGSRRAAPLFTRWRIIIAAVVAACVAGAAIGLATTGSSPSSATAAQVARNQGATPGTSTAPAAQLPSQSQAAQSPSQVGNPPTTTNPATTAPAPNALGVPLKNPATGKCLSGSAGSDGTPLILLACDGNVNQMWRIAADGTIQTKGLCMDAAWGATSPGTVVQIAYCSGNPAQQFSLRGDTIYTSHADLCVAVANGGAGIRLAACNGDRSERFQRG
jgi:Ricin-type beta-trefoil lectin domain